jgi:hypothetical protein
VNAKLLRAALTHIENAGWERIPWPCGEYTAILAALTGKEGAS